MFLYNVLAFQVRRLISRGQLEILLGGWVMPDEAITYFAPVIDQLIEGHQWLIENLGVSPVNAWINDPFGYSSSMPYFWKSSGIQNMVILRIHQAIKHTLMRKGSLDFMWRPYWNSDDLNDILCNLMPYIAYWNSNVCGPDRNICKQFNFLHLHTHNRDNAKPVTEQNIEFLASELYKAYKFTASFYKYNNLIIFIGEDNSFDTRESWSDTYENYGKLMAYINSKSEWKMKLKFGTIKEYFKHIRKVEKEKGYDSLFPVLSGDFFPYSDIDNDYWTGYFTTRPWIKRLTREVEPLIRAADKFNVYLFDKCIMSKGCTDIQDAYKIILEELRAARREVGIFQHHDGITGTSLPFVVNDYEMRLMKAFKSAQKALTLSIALILTDGGVQAPYSLVDNNEKEGARFILTPKLHQLKNGNLKLYVANPLERARKAVVSFYTDKVEISVSNVLSHQISESSSSKFRNLNLVTIFVDLSPFEIKMIAIQAKTSSKNVPPNLESIEKSNIDTQEIITIQNKWMKVEFNGDGSLKGITDKLGRRTEITNDFMKYKPLKSGAYLFGPQGPAKAITELPSPEVSVSNGPVYSQVKVAYRSGFVQKWVLYHTDDIMGQALHLTQEINLGIEPKLIESEVILRFKTNINNRDIFFTDQNGYQLIGRKNDRTRPIETNYYPMTSMVVIEDRTKRLTLHSAQSHGTASLQDGWLEVMLDRNMRHDDKKGLGMGATERIASLSEFILQIEYKTTLSDIQEVRYTHASLTSIMLNEQLQNRPQLFSVEQQSDKFLLGFNPFQHQKPLPCDTSIVILRNLATNDLSHNGTSLVLHRKPIHCSFTTDITLCTQSSRLLTFADLRLGLTPNLISYDVTETSLTHVNKIASINISDDIRPKENELRTFLIKPTALKPS